MLSQPNLRAHSHVLNQIGGALERKELSANGPNANANAIAISDSPANSRSQSPSLSMDRFPPNEVGERLDGHPSEGEAADPLASWLLLLVRQHQDPAMPR